MRNWQGVGRAVTALGAAILLCQAPYAAANNALVGGGGSCTGVTETDGTQMVQQAYDDGIYTCGTGSTFVPEALIVGSVTDTGVAPTCSSTTAGMLYYTGGIIEYCNGTSFASFSTDLTGTIGASGSGLTVELAAGSAAAPSLTFNEDTTTGLYQVGTSDYLFVTTGGAERAAFDNAGNFDITNASNASTGAYQINGSTILAVPIAAGFVDTSSTAVGSGALPTGGSCGSGPISPCNNTALGASALAANTPGFSNPLPYGYENTALGTYALEANTNGNDNTAVGIQALSANITGNDNTAVGDFTLNESTGDTDNTAIGDSALENMNGGSYNSALGDYTLNQSTADTDNTAVGDNALYSTNGGGYNTGIGDYALYSNITGADNTAIGDSALYSTTNSFSTAVGGYALNQAASGPNEALGYNAGLTIDSGIYNVAIGYYAMSGAVALIGYIPAGSANVAVGDWALDQSADTAADNTVLGFKAGYAVTTGTDNTLVGWKAGYGVTGSSNIILGEDPGSAITSGSSNILIGNSLGQVTNSTNSQIDIGDVIVVAGDTHLATHGSTPTQHGTSCGNAGFTIAGNDNAMVITQGSTSSTTCLISFATTWTSTPVCEATFSASGFGVIGTSATSTVLTLNLAASLNSKTINVICQGYK